MAAWIASFSNRITAEIFRGSASYISALVAKCPCPSIQFDSKRALGTTKIDNVATNAELSAKLLAEKFASLKALPEGPLRPESLIYEVSFGKQQPRKIAAN
jgi:hypothetical protein